MANFTFTPSYQLSESSAPVVRKVQFQEAGYEHRLKFGLNSDLKELRLVFANRTDTQRDDILSFLEARQGSEAFTFTSPRTNTSSLYVCEVWDVSMESFNNNTITATFREVAG